MKAYVITPDGFGVSLWWAVSAGKARWKCVKALRSAGYYCRRGEWPKMRCVRRPELDKKEVAK